ncbi:hypothetical protein CA54_29720 [Symmachiella macrocystis]|uniref:Putative glutamine amidotransferase domain-containing protein n=1 Tax=Symmachiella macrocystis TaxID=2527985 RepID=A0A5C6BTC0_9PLAN|nr:glutamine amidotransferase [Symmachiella macrocystis]TWU14129.1 hypothetical protein CA54_29720 [Symmachiella macrocystis]
MFDIFPDNLQPRIEPIWPWPVVVVVSIVLLVIVLRSYRQRVAHLSRGTRFWLLGLRTVAALLLIWAMFRPSLVLTETDERSGQLVLVHENSRSLDLADGPGGLTRWETILKTLADNQDLLDQIKEKVEVVHYEFNSEITQVDKPSSAADGEMTAIGHALEYLTRTLQPDVVTGVFLFSDGAQRALPPFDIDPRGAVRQYRAAHNAPIHTVGVGSSSLTDSTMDQIAEDLKVNPTVFEKNQVLVGANIRALGVANRDLTVKLMVEDPSIRDPNKNNMKLAAPAQKLRTTRTQDVLPVEFTWTPQYAGEYKISIEVEPLEGELITSNNVLTTFVTVLKGGLSVAYFDIWRPEMGKLAEVGRSPDIQIDRQIVRYRGEAEPTKIQDEWFEPGRYDVYIIGDVPAKVFGERNLRRLAEAVSQGAGLIMTGGFHSFGAGGYATTPLQDLLPVVMYPTEILNEDELDESLQISNPVQMLPTIEGRGDFVMRMGNLGDESTGWEQLPKLEGATKLTPKKLGLARVLAETETQQPLLIAQEYNPGRVMAFAGDTTYLWYLAGFANEQQQFWRQVILWLANKDSQGDDSVWVKLEGRRFRPGQKVPFTFGARDEEGKPLTDVEFQTQVVGPEDKRYPVAPQRSGDLNFGEFAESALPGEYRVEVSAVRNGKPLGYSAKARFVVFEQDLEMYNPAADPSLLQEISSVTQGRFLLPEDFRGFLEELIDKGINRQLTQNKVVSLWDNWILLVCFVGVMSTEWFLRKKRGMV